MKIGIISDTHGSFNNDVRMFLNDVDEIWHAGDIGNIGVADEVAAFKPLRAVCGNIDGDEVRRCYPQVQRFDCEGMDVLMTHIGGFPGHYDAGVRNLLYSRPPKIFVCGHSHILRVMYDKKLQCLCLNPGAAGNSGFHKVRTALRFSIANGKPDNLQIGEWQRAAA